MKINTRFIIIYAFIFIVWGCVYGSIVTNLFDNRVPNPFPHQSKSTKSPIDPKDYGDVHPYDGYMTVALAPNSDLQLRKWELGLGRVAFTTAGLAVSDDGKNFTPINGEPTADCLYHWQGQGINAIVAINSCVPDWATVSGDPQHHHALEWIRVENLGPKPRVILLSYK